MARPVSPTPSDGSDIAARASALVQQLRQRALEWAPLVEGGFYSSASDDDVFARFPTGEREGALVLLWRESRQLIVHGGRVALRAHTTVVHPSLLVLQLDAPVLAWKEVFETREDPQRYIRGPEREMHAGVMYGASGTLLIHGGKDAAGTVRNETFIFSMVRRMWEPLARWTGGCMAPRMYGHAMAALPQGAVIVVGIAEGAAQRTAKRPRGTAESSATGLATFVLQLVGEDKQWRRVTTVGAPSRRRDFSMAADATGTALYLAGGRYSRDVFDDVYALNVASDTWRRVEMTSVGRGLVAAPVIATPDVDADADDDVLAHDGSGPILIVSAGPKAVAVATHDPAAGDVDVRHREFVSASKVRLTVLALASTAEARPRRLGVGVPTSPVSSTGGAATPAYAATPRELACKVDAADYAAGGAALALLGVSAAGAVHTAVVRADAPVARGAPTTAAASQSLSALLAATQPARSV